MCLRMSHSKWASDVVPLLYPFARTAQILGVIASSSAALLNFQTGCPAGYSTKGLCGGLIGFPGSQVAPAAVNTWESPRSMFGVASVHGLRHFLA